MDEQSDQAGCPKACFRRAKRHKGDPSVRPCISNEI
jgi:hypothetical protein